VQPDEQFDQRVQQPVDGLDAPRVGEDRAVRRRVGEELGDQDRVAVLLPGLRGASTRSTAIPTASTAGTFRSASARSTWYSRRASRSLSSLSAYKVPSSYTNRTTCREMPRWRISTSRSSRHCASGTDHGRVSSPDAWSAGGVKTNRT
jgi:hypothetical protein